MDTREILIWLSHVETYPVKLARIVGCECAILWWSIYKKYGFIKFRKIESGHELGVLKPEEALLRLVFHGLITKDENEEYQVNSDRFFELVDHESLSTESPPPFSDPRFIQLINKYINFLKSKGRSVNKNELYERLRQRTLDECIKSLSYAIDNGHVTLFFNDGGAAKFKTNDKGYGGRAGARSFASGGSKVRSVQGDSKAEGFSADDI